MTIPHHVIQRFGEEFGTYLDSLESLDCFKQSLMAHSDHRSDQKVWSTVDSEGQASEVLAGNVDAIRSWTRNCVFYIMENNFFLFSTL